ncbi:MAG: hypothetical protein KJS68_15130, partial [Alphaproteobacteria bacterium]|nr:hypothetical protein [Alphaproteobacteria bacterium]
VQIGPCHRPRVIAISIKHSIQTWEWQTLVSTTGRNDKLPHTIASANQVGGDGTRAFGRMAGHRHQ